VARTLAAEKRAAGYAGEVRCRRVESKLEVRAILHEIAAAGERIDELHFVGHSGMYGPMFGTIAFPEQLSPWEWETLAIPFAPGARAFFHCCRSARWFAPFFARTFGVPAGGFFWYTTFSTSRTRYRRERREPEGVVEAPLYTIGCKGRKSHGWLAAARKRAGLMPAERMRMFDPAPPEGDPTYDPVAELYDRTFADIRVRIDEWRWLLRHLPPAEAASERSGLRLLDIGCGNGALLSELAPRLAYGAGVDESAAILERARRRNAEHPQIELFQVDSPHLPFPDAAFDVAVSLLSFRYLDWDPLMAEIKRVVRPGGKLLIVDMVTVPLRARELPAFLRDKIRGVLQRWRNPAFHRDLDRLVAHPDWKTMLRYNPIRSEHEMKWYLESRFKGREVEILNYGWHARTLAFDAGSVENGIDVKLTYP
jgi:SAM-dependent methyltransferase